MVEGRGFRERVLVTLLDRYEELSSPLRGPSGVPGDGDALGLMPVTYTASVKELERLLGVMRTDARSLWWHTNQYFIACEWKTMDVPVKRKGKGGKTITVVERQVVRRHDPAVRLEKVRRGVTWLASNWAGPSEPFLPVEIVVGVAA